jgi:hypothetical protein
MRSTNPNYPPQEAYHLSRTRMGDHYRWQAWLYFAIMSEATRSLSHP